MRPVHVRDERGASTVEYGMIVSAIACVVVGVVVSLGNVVEASLSDSCAVIASTISSSTC